jgi:hypothetical protein
MATSELLNRYLPVQNHRKAHDDLLALDTPLLPQNLYQRDALHLSACRSDSALEPFPGLVRRIVPGFAGEPDERAVKALSSTLTSLASHLNGLQALSQAHATAADSASAGAGGAKRTLRRGESCLKAVAAVRNKVHATTSDLGVDVDVASQWLPSRPAGSMPSARHGGALPGYVKLPPSLSVLLSLSLFTHANFS